MKNKFLTISFLVIIFGVFLFVPAKEMLIRIHKVNFYKTDNWKTVESTNDKIYDKIMSLESFIENRYNNYFPFYNKINSLYYNANMKIDSIYLNDIYLKENNDQDKIFYNKDNKFYYLVNHYSKDELKDRSKEYLDFYNGIAAKYPDVKVSLYVPLRYEYTTAKNVNKTNELVYDFTSKLDKNISYKVLDSKNTKEYLKNFYKTDHHYNANGAYKAYTDILDMWGIENNISLKTKEIKNPYYGSIAKSLLTTIVKDTLFVLDYKNDIIVNIDDVNFKPLEVENKANPFYDYYVKYFNGQYDEVIYENSNEYNRNLLIVGDSMSWQIDYLLASNFDNTYVINIRYGKWKKNNLELEKYINENHITHILFLMESKNIIFDADNYKLASKVVY